jgi:hypothetical protein
MSVSAGRPLGQGVCPSLDRTRQLVNFFQQPPPPSHPHPQLTTSTQSSEDFVISLHISVIYTIVNNVSRRLPLLLNETLSPRHRLAAWRDGMTTLCKSRLVSPQSETKNSGAYFLLFLNAWIFSEF